MVTATAPKTLTVIDKDVFDALELSALINGGIGGGDWGDADHPVCLVGHIQFLAYGAVWPVNDPTAAEQNDAVILYEAVRGGDFGIIGPNDRAVRAINDRKGRSAHTKVSWAEYIKQRGWVRGK